MQSYKLAEPVHVDMVDPVVIERFTADFPAGVVTPKSEREQAALEHLVGIGYADRVKGKG